MCKKTKFHVSLLLLLMLFLLPIKARADQTPITLKVNGSILKIDVSPFIVKGRTYVPIRWIGEHLGMKVNWSENPEIPGTLSIILAAKNGREIYVDKYSIYASDGLCFHSEYHDKDTAYIIKNNRTFLPIRSIANALHLKTYWNQESRTVTLETNNNNDVYTIYAIPNDSDGEEQFTAPFKIEWKNNRYQIKDKDITVQEASEIIWDFVYEKDDNGNYDKLDKVSKFILEYNCYEMDTDGYNITAYYDPS